MSQRKTDLPMMPSCTRCGECCTITFARPEEAKRIRAYAKENEIEWIVPPDQENGLPDITCGFLRKSDDGTFACGVYPVRPWQCRAFGVVSGMACTYFPEDVVLDISPEEAVKRRLIDPDDKPLGAHFEKGYMERMEPAFKEAREHAAIMHALGQRPVHNISGRD